MCGIAGVVGKADESLIHEMTSALFHRGPDDEGYYRGEAISLGVRRLSIIDLGKGGQPISNEAGDKRIVFNGEIYNYRELRSELAGRGHAFATASDTEVILHAYEEYGEQCVNRLRGMFAFAIADGERLFIARDRLGIKPLYYAHLKEQGLFLFASEIKALLRCGAVDAALDQEMLCDWLILGHGSDERTYFRGVKSLPPGHCLRVEMSDGGLSFTQRKYYEVSLSPSGSLTFADAAERLGELLREAVEGHLVADVGIGLTLSGGLDSTLLALIMARYYSEPIKSFTVSDQASPDTEQARAIAGQIKSAHSEILSDFEDFLGSIPEYVLAEEQPGSLYGLPLFSLCRHIGRHVKVCLNGEGADELFGGYPDYLNRRSKVARLEAGLARAKSAGLRPRDSVVEYITRLGAAQSDDEYLESLFLFNLKPQLVHNHLHLLDKYSMSSSLEMRVPYLDHYLVDFVNGLPLSYKVNASLGIRKYILKRAAIGSYGDIVINAVLRKKLGFPSSGRNFQRQFDELCERSLPPEYAQKHEMRFYYTYRTEEGHKVSKRALLMFDLFSLIFMEGRGSVPAGFDLREFIRSKG